MTLAVLLPKWFGIALRILQMPALLPAASVLRMLFINDRSNNGNLTGPVGRPWLKR